MISQWLFDSGSSKYLIPDRKNLTEYRDFLFYEVFRYGTAAGDIAETKGVGYINVNLDAGDSHITTLRVEAYY